MGWTTGETCYERMDLDQTPGNVRAVRLRAGWTPYEVAAAINEINDWDIHGANIEMAESGEDPLLGGEWLAMLNVCSRRMFDDAHE